jgi:plastocyanin
VSLTAKEFSFTPNAVTAKLGSPVKFTLTNAGKFQHNLVIELEGQGIEKKMFDTNLQPGETRTAEFSFTQAGKWKFYCPVDGHEARGMVGSIDVNAAIGGTNPGTVPTTGAESPEGEWLLIASLGFALTAGGLLVRRFATAHRS